MNHPKKLKILKTEGNWGQKSLNCSILINNKPIHTISPFSLCENLQEIDLPPSETLSILLKDQYRTDIGSVSVPIALLPLSKFYLPIQSPSKSETISSIPKEVQIPRILVSVTDIPAKIGHDEIFGSYFEQSDPFESFASEIVLASLIESPGIETEDFIGKSDLQIKYKKQNMIIKILSKQLEINNEKVAQLQKKTESLEGKLLKANENLEKNIENSNEREKILLEVIQGKDNEIHQSTSTNMAIQGKIRVLENEKEHFKDQVQRMELEIERLKELENELEIANEKLKKSENIQEHLNKTILKISKNISESDEDLNNKSQIISKDQEIQMLKNIIEEVKKSGDMQVFSLNLEIEDLKQMLLTSKEQEKCLALKLVNLEVEKNTENRPNLGGLGFVDLHFSDAMNKLGLNGCFSKLKDYTYQVKGKVVSVAICRGGVFARVGSSLVNLEEFLEDLLEKTENSSIKDESFNAKTERFIENSHENKSFSRNSSQKSFLKSTQSSSNKTRGFNEKILLKDRNRNRSSERRAFK